MTLIIGLTGSIASGKSTISNMFSKHDIHVIDADKIARDVVLPGEHAYKQIVEAFGEDILFNDKIINREKLGSLIFSDETKRKQLNDMIHPEIRKKMLKQRDAYVDAGERTVVLDIPLLFESNLTHFVDKIVVVYVDEDVQLNRLMTRDGYSKKEALQRINSQMSLKEKSQLADATIDNNGTIKQSWQQLNKLLKKWQAI